MSYQVIARKWRPQTFEEVTGQEPITQTLRNAIEHDRLHHAYLFSGARGVGKTTTARLVAKALNCHKTGGPNIHPCRPTDADACVSCIEISESRSMDVLEIDAASHTGIDDVRDTIIDGITINPARDRYKVFIIDEVHQLSKPAFNALLKTLEEPPQNVVFVMATTELHKVPGTITSRCQEFQFRTIPLQKIFDRLKLIAQAEKINVDDPALREIARSGDGSMRDAQSNFDQVISFAGERIEVGDVVNALGLASAEMLIKVLDAIAEKQPTGVLAVVGELAARGQDFRNFCRDLLGLFRDLLVAKVGGPDAVSETSVFAADEIERRAGMFSESDLIRFFNSLAETEIKLKDVARPQYLLEIGLVKLIEMRRIAAIEGILDRLRSLEASTNDGKASLKAAAAPESRPADAFPEKKTLKSEEPEDAMAAQVDERFDDPPPEPDIEISAPQPVIDLDRFASMPVRLPPISSEELDHIEDEWLDEAYERKLSMSGDDLLPIVDAAKLALAVHGRKSAEATGPIIRNGGTAAAVKPALEIPDLAPSYGEDSEPSELPILGDSPTKEELFAYAQAHPAVKRAMRVFRAKLTDVTKI